MKTRKQFDEVMEKNTELFKEAEAMDQAADALKEGKNEDVIFEQCVKAVIINNSDAMEIFVKALKRDQAKLIKDLSSDAQLVNNISLPQLTKTEKSKLKELTVSKLEADRDGFLSEIKSVV